MGIVNRRNIAIGYGAWRLGRTLSGLRRSEPEPEPEPPKRHRVAKAGAVAAGALAVAGAVVFWRSRDAGGPSEA
jgi:hypothetical protein